MDAAIDVGSNTIRMLLGDCCDGVILPHSCYREITRLGGDFSPQTGLSAAAMERALVTLRSFADIIDAAEISQIRVVATAVLRRAKNRHTFLAQVAAATGLKIEVITGEEEARLTTLGTLSAIAPAPEAAIIVDIGGGSTELVCLVGGEIRLQKSYPIGVVNLCEEFFSVAQRQQQIDHIILQFSRSLQQVGLTGIDYQFLGTAGTITTLAAIHLKLDTYNPLLINNHEISMDWMKTIQADLEQLSASEREQLIGMEKGRGDLILPGLQILLTLMDQFQFSTLKVSDYGLLEGVMLQLTET